MSKETYDGSRLRCDGTSKQKLSKTGNKIAAGTLLFAFILGIVGMVPAYFAYIDYAKISNPGVAGIIFVTIGFILLAISISIGICAAGGAFMKYREYTKIKRYHTYIYDIANIQNLGQSATTCVQVLDIINSNKIKVYDCRSGEIFYTSDVALTPVWDEPAILQRYPDDTPQISEKDVALVKTVSDILKDVPEFEGGKRFIKDLDRLTAKLDFYRGNPYPPDDEGQDNAK